MIDILRRKRGGVGVGMGHRGKVWKGAVTALAVFLILFAFCVRYIQKH